MKTKNSFAALLVVFCVVSGTRAQEREGGYFRILVTGFTCNRQTSDDPLQRDGVDDEVQIYADTYELTPTRDEFAQPLGFYLKGRSVMSAVIGDTNNHADRVQGGSGHNIFGGNGGFRSGDSFPDATPWAPSRVFQGRRDVQLNRRPPMVIWEGSLYRNLSAVILVPTIWEMDDQRMPERRDDESRLPLLAAGGKWGEASSNITRLAPLLVKLASDAKADYSPVTNQIRDSFNRYLLIAKQATPEPTDRPIGMKDRGNYFAFTPEVLALTYDVAEELSRRSFNGTLGVFAINYHDDGELNGDYTLYLKVERQ
jgi:hypothetical protein